VRRRVQRPCSLGIFTNGDADDETITGGSAFDEIDGGDGNDLISGGGDIDSLKGGEGDDTLVGNKGNDTLLGQAGDDLMVWNNGDGSDLMDGGEGDDRVQVNFNTDLVNDNLDNRDFAEFSVTDEGVQFARVELNGQTENGLFELDIRYTETVETNFGDGDDRAFIVGDVLNEIAVDLDGGAGVDVLDLINATPGIEANLNGQSSGSLTVVNFEDVIGSSGDDTITGNDEANVLQGEDGNDHISGLGDTDEIDGGIGDDTLVGGKGDDVVTGGTGNDLLVWNNGDGSDFMDGGAGDDRVQVNFNTDLVNDNLDNKDVAAFTTSEFFDVQFARVGLNDQAVNGLFQLDIVNTETLETNFGDGDDTAQISVDVLDQIALDLDGGAGVDLLDFSDASQQLEVNLASGAIGSAEFENFENVTGGAFADQITGDAADNVLSGGAGDDSFVASLGSDTVFGGTGEDSAVFSGDFADFNVFSSGGDDITVNGGLAGVTTLNGVELLVFDDQTFSV
ncbi:MAG: calcium-binding protein, partial [Pseudomonadota bacterium]